MKAMIWSKFYDGWFEYYYCKYCGYRIQLTIDTKPLPDVCPACGEREENMNATGKNFTKRQVMKEFAKQYDMLRCECFKQNFEDITRQTISVMISGMLMHGYSEQQCKEIFEVLVDMFAMPKFFGRAITTDVTIQKCEEIGIDLSRIKVHADIK